MNAPSVDVKDILAGVSSLALTYGTNLFVHKMADTTNVTHPAVIVKDSGGFPAEGTDQGTGGMGDHDYQKPTVQIMVRGERGGYTAAETLARDIRKHLDGLTDETVGGTRYILIRAQSDVLDIGEDDNDRPELSVNFLIHRTTA